MKGSFSWCWASTETGSVLLFECCFECLVKETLFRKDWIYIVIVASNEKGEAMQWAFRKIKLVKVEGEGFGYI